MAAAPCALAAAASVLWWWSAPPALGTESAPAALSPLLALPLLVATAFVVATVLWFWPTFARRRPGQSLVERLQRGPLGGCGRALLGALLAQAVLTLPLLLALPALFGAPPFARAVVPLVADGAFELHEGQPRVGFALPDLPLQELAVAPVALLPRGAFAPTQFDVFVDGRHVAATTEGVADTRHALRLPLPECRGARLELVWRTGTIPLLFPNDTAKVATPAVHARAWNGALAALLLLAPTFVALALATLAGRGAALPTTLGVAGCAWFVQTVGGLGPFAPTVLAVLRGHWLGSGSLFPSIAASLAVGSLAMIAAMLLRARLRP
ncbi:MAG: hypothetical protein JNK15_25500 [Planctomycetes bacterium]|nr:hypothetical protein [Planctomycetota bacterium]